MNQHAATFFNPTLFTINKRPMKFYLDGYNNHEVNEIARIIEAFGGKLSTPDENTIIFSEPGRRFTIDRCRYHIQCLHDSIVARKLQDLEQYRIPLVKEEIIESSEYETSISDPPAEPATTTQPVPSLVKPWKIVSVLSYAEADETNRVQSSNHTLENEDMSSGSAPADSESSELGTRKMKKKRRSSTRGKMRRRSAISGNKSCNQQEIGLKRKRTDSQNLSDSSNEETSLPVKKNRLLLPKSTDEENKILLNYLIENEIISRVHDKEIWKDMEAAHIFLEHERTAKNLQKFFFNHLQYDLAKYIDDEKILAEFDKTLRRKR